MNKIKKIIKKTPILYFYKWLNSKYNKIKLLFGNNAVILLYHRVDDVKDDPLLLSVSLKNFHDQMKYLKENYVIVSMNDLVHKIKNNKSIRKNVAITFDDGYADNLYNALPILEEMDIPVTIFVTSGKVDDTRPFFWDEYTNKEDQGRSMSESELETLSEHPLVEIGGHTISHMRLSQLDFKEQFTEINEGKKSIEKITGKEVRSFAFPFGTKSDYNKDTIDILKKIGFAYACANTNNFVNNKSDILELPRFLVRDWDLSEFKIHF